MYGKKLKSIALFLLLVLQLPLYVYSQEKKYYVTETQLKTLEEITKEQSRKLEEQKVALQQSERELTIAYESIQKLNLELENQAKYLSQLERNNVLNSVTIGTVGFTIGIGAGIIAMAIYGGFR